MPWLALGTVYLLGGRTVGDRVRTGLLLFTGFAIGVMLAAPIHGAIAPDGGIPVGKDHFGVLPRVLAGVGSGVGAVVVFGGALWSAIRFAPPARPGTGPLAGGNALIALGTLVLSSGGLLQGIVGQDEAFALTLAVGIAVIYARLRRRVVGTCRARRLSTAVDARCRRRGRRRRQLAAHELARERARQLVDELDARRQLVAREPAARVAQQLDRVGMRAGLRRRRTRRRVSPVRGCGSPTTATSATSGCCASTSRPRRDTR